MIDEKLEGKQVFSRWWVSAAAWAGIGGKDGRFDALEINIAIEFLKAERLKAETVYEAC